MNLAEISGLISTGLGALVSVTVLLAWRKNRSREVAEKIRCDMRIQGELAAVKQSQDTLKLQNEMLLTGNRQLNDKMDRQGERLTRVEQIIDDAQLAEIPTRLAKLEESAKSAHRRIDELTAGRKQE